jgi:pimeloyl-ACP methyl ester carboxylesterase
MERVPAHSKLFFNVRSCGSSERSLHLVFLHEGLGCITLWKDFPEKLCAASGCPGLLYDRLGHGRSPADPSPRTIHYLHRHALEELPQVLAEAIPGKPYVLVGHSDGGSIALLHAAECPPLLRGVVTMAAHVLVEPQTVAGIAAAERAYEGGRMRGLARHHGDKAETLFHAWAQTWQSPWFAAWNIEYALPSITCPLLVIQGEDDQYGSRQQVERIVAGTSGPATPVLLPGCGHTPYHDKEKEVIAWIVDFLGSLGRPA